ncbi:Atp6v0a1 protein [Salpingoeca rosetta]|uniref:V-type proton ATPase subunit a n=1 Tax=Salpingoeca rosetta (strain ATCC 50818 / BSB-021) TaxID=946362 RepID=F2UDD5_SALR5|nr:Atp6v0a1 protein [Salpingoeca rosetta]EGD74630.1 Atp6v0a1 protein [Salpingoeca rosetta]|eukprot:XP_004992887.1 Atp6v0a1 protein [Salpingoeca rosetta]
MGTLWRSQEMGRAKLFVPSEVSYEVVSALGDIGLVQFIDANPDLNAFQRKFVNEVRRCDEMERKLRFFESEIEKLKLEINGAEEAASMPAPDMKGMHSMEAEFDRLEREMKEINNNEQVLKKQNLELTELHEILNRTAMFFDEAESATAALSADTADSSNTPLLEADERSGQLAFVTGVIARERVPGFERLLWRACRGNVFLRRVPIDEPVHDPTTGDEIHKEVFIVFYQGEQLGNRVKKICEGYDATIYPCPNLPSKRRELREGVKTRILDLQNVLHRTEDHRRHVLSTIAFKLGGWIVQVKKIKAIFHTMNKFNVDGTRKSLIAEVWYPLARVDEIQHALRVGTSRAGSDMQAILNDIPHDSKPPTAYFTTKFTRGFQSIVDAYGVATYREVNPGPFTIITFPFLFAVMFGDLGHGFLMMLVALMLVLKEKSLKNFDGGEIWDTMFNGRYIILLMGLFSMYTGFVYNDIFSKALSFGSGWSISEEEIPMNITGSATLELRAPYLDLNGTLHNGDLRHAYAFGIDPMWQVSENKLTFTNSYKMKLSVILGVLQMLFGVVLSLFNHRFFKKSLRIWHEFIPQTLFLSCIFGYLVICILYKWSTPLDDFPNQSAPSLLIMLINMFLRFGLPPPKEQVLYGDKEGNLQGKVQMALVVIAVVCVPWMLLTRPLILRSRQKRREREAEARVRAGMLQGSDDDHDDGHGDEEHSFGEMMVHQAIHTIEFCLGCISNTASYLRLWALSLAHAQLSEVLWDMVLHNGFTSWYLLFCAFAVWAVLTIGVLLIMEGLSAFLHALRLHWVEFQNKFYDGNGYLFTPFHFERVLKGQDDDAA